MGQARGPPSCSHGRSHKLSRARERKIPGALAALTDRPRTARYAADPGRSPSLLDRGCDAESLFWADEVVVVIGVGVELHPLDLAVEVTAGSGVVLAHRCTGAGADVAGLVAGVDHRHG